MTNPSESSQTTESLVESEIESSFHSERFISSSGDLEGSNLSIDLSELSDKKKNGEEEDNVKETSKYCKLKS